MPKYHYRPSECLVDGVWEIAGIAYEEDGQIFWFSPPGRPQRIPFVNKLELLHEEHLAEERSRWGKDYRWGAVTVVTADSFYPSQVLREAAGLVPSEQLTIAPVTLPNKVLRIFQKDKGAERTLAPSVKQSSASSWQKKVLALFKGQRSESRVGQHTKYRIFRSYTKEQVGDIENADPAGKIPKRNSLYGEWFFRFGTVCLFGALLIPIFARGRDNARKTHCINNLKQVSLALMQYSQDWDECLPTGSPIKNGAGWAVVTLPYIKSVDLFRCPSDSYNPSSGSQISYAYNQAISFKTNGYSGSGNLSEFTATARTVLLFEVTNCSFDPIVDGPLTPLSPAGNGFGAMNDPARPPSMTSSTARYATGFMANSSSSLNLMGGPVYDSSSGRHFGGANWVFCDGHVKYLHASDVSAGLAAPNSKAAPSGDTRPYNAAGTRLSEYMATFSPI